TWPGSGRCCTPPGTPSAASRPKRWAQPRCPAGRTAGTTSTSWPSTAGGWLPSVKPSGVLWARPTPNGSATSETSPSTPEERGCCSSPPALGPSSSCSVVWRWSTSNASTRVPDRNSTLRPVDVPTGSPTTRPAPPSCPCSPPSSPPPSASTSTATTAPRSPAASTSPKPPSATGSSTPKRPPGRPFRRPDQPRSRATLNSDHVVTAFQGDGAVGPFARRNQAAEEHLGGEVWASDGQV